MKALKHVKQEESNEHKLINCTVDNVNTQAEYLRKSVELANREDIDYFISIHFNTGGGIGPVATIVTTPSSVPCSVASAVISATGTIISWIFTHQKKIT